ncbi:MAG: right-handed parallel beta-helix repeat-containing protein [Promethearchaeota archaeon]
MRRDQNILIAISILIVAFISGLSLGMLILSGASDQGVGGNTYICLDEGDINAAIDDIGTGKGTIVIYQNITITSTLRINGEGDYLIEGVGLHFLTSNALDISLARSCIIRNLFLEGISPNYLIRIANYKNYPVRLENLKIISKTEYSGVGISVNSDNVWILDCQIQNFDEGIYIYSGVSRVTIQSCDFSHLSSAAFNVRGVYNEIRDNTITDCRFAVFLSNNNNNNRILDNDISDYTDQGIYLLSSDNNLITGNYIHDNGLSDYDSDAIFIGGYSDINLMINNYLKNLNLLDAGDVAYGIRFSGSYHEYNVVTNNIFHDVEIAINGANATDIVTDNTIITSP